MLIQVWQDVTQKAVRIVTHLWISLFFNLLKQLHKSGPQLQKGLFFESVLKGHEFSTSIQSICSETLSKGGESSSVVDV